MNVEEFLIAKEEIEKEYKQKLHKLNNVCVKSNDKYAIGDIISDQNNSISITSKKIYFRGYENFPMIVYYGDCVTKKGLLFKKPKKASIYEENIIVK